MNEKDILELQKFACKIRIGTVEAIKSRGFGHIGGTLSMADTLSVLYKKIMNYDANNPRMLTRDKLVCSKGHAGPAVYATLALCGFFPYDDLKTLNQPGTKLPSHCDKKLNGIDATTGSLGQGTSQAVGIALADKLSNRNCQTFVVVGDGELNEGQCWEAAMFTAGKKLTNLTWIIDWNKKQLDGTTDEILPAFDFVEKFKAFGFDAIKVKGDDIEQIYEALSKPAENKPKAIILDSIKGCGVKAVEQTVANHSMQPPAEEFDKWLAELHTKLDELNKEAQ